MSFCRKRKHQIMQRVRFPSSPLIAIFVAILLICVGCGPKSDCETAEDVDPYPERLVIVSQKLRLPSTSTDVYVVLDKETGREFIIADDNSAIAPIIQEKGLEK